MRSSLLLLLLLGACSGTSAPVVDSSESDAGSQSDGGTSGGDATTAPPGQDSGTSPTPDGGSTADTAPPVQYDDVTINFDELQGETVVTSTYPTVGFTSDQAALDVVAFDPTFVGQSKPNFICAGTRCDGGFVMTFTKPVEALHFNAVGVNAGGKAATINVYESGTLTKTLDLVGKGSLTTPVPVDLSSAHAVTKVEVTDVTDFAGIGLDDFTFKAPR
jgi:hypothetical protein